jgi:hypothetical protein
MIRAAVVLAMVVACGRRTEELAPSPDQPALVRDAGVGTRKLGESCVDAACAAGLRCVSWTTNDAEARATCEVPCAPDYFCPAGTHCVHQRGGPSGVCRRR